MQKLAVTISVECMIPAHDYDDRINDILDEMERGLQYAEAEYRPILVQPGISAESGEAL